MRKVLYKGKSEGKLYNSIFTNTPSWLLWHSRLGHPNHHVLSLLFPNKSVYFNKYMTLVNTCRHCLQGKMHKLSFLFLNLLRIHHLSFFILIYGVLHLKILLMLTSIMCNLLIIFPVLLGCIF